MAFYTSYANSTSDVVFTVSGTGSAWNNTGYFYSGASTIPCRLSYPWPSEQAREAFEADDADALSEELGIDYEPNPHMWTEVVQGGKANIIKWLWDNISESLKASAVQEVMLNRKWTLLDPLLPQVFDRRILETAIHFLKKAEFEPLEKVLALWGGVPEDVHEELIEAAAYCKLLDGYQLVKDVVGEERVHESILWHAVPALNLNLVKYLVDELGLPFDPEAVQVTSFFGVQSTEMLAYLLEKGLDPQRVMRRLETRTLLLRGRGSRAFSGHLLTTLLDYGATPQDSFLPRIVAMREVTLLERVLQKPPKDWGSALHEAISGASGVAILVNAGCPITRDDFMLASRLGKTDYLECFLEKGFRDYDFDALPEEQQKLVRSFHPTLWDHLDD